MQVQRTTAVATMQPERQRKANLRLALILASVALAFFVGFIVKMSYFGHGGA